LLRIHVRLIMNADSCWKCYNKQLARSVRGHTIQRVEAYMHIVALLCASGGLLAYTHRRPGIRETLSRHVNCGNDAWVIHHSYRYGGVHKRARVCVCGHATRGTDGTHQARMYVAYLLLTA
jgi:hypothetical protein